MTTIQSSRNFPVYSIYGMALTCSLTHCYILSSSEHSALLQDRPAADWFSECSLQHHWSPDRHCELLLPSPQVWSFLLLGLRHSCPLHWDGHEPQVKVSSNWRVDSKKGDGSWLSQLQAPGLNVTTSCKHCIFFSSMLLTLVHLRQDTFN